MLYVWNIVLPIRRFVDDIFDWLQEVNIAWVRDKVSGVLIQMSCNISDTNVVLKFDIGFNMIGANVRCENAEFEGIDKS